MNNIRGLDRKTFRFALPWTIITLVSALCLRALNWGAPEGSLATHLRYGLSQQLHSSVFSFLMLCLVCFLLAIVEAEALRREKRAVYLPALVLAVLFSLNTLIFQSPTGTLQNLTSIPGCGETEGMLHWLAQVGSWYSLTLAFCHWMGRPLGKGEPGNPSVKQCISWAGVMLLLWLPILILRAPGAAFLDTNAQILQFMGLLPWESSNPILLTFVYGPVFCLGRLLGGDNGGLLLCVVVQAVVNLYAFTFACREVARERDVKSAWLLCLFFGLMPNFPSFVAAVLKDFLHAPLYLVFALYFRRSARGGQKRDLWWLLGLAVLCAATRKAAVYLVLLCLIGLCVSRKDCRKILIPAICGILVGHIALINVVFPAAGVEKPMEKENYSFFYPITGYYCQQHGQELTPEEKKIIGDVLDYETVCTGFSDRGVDTIKETYHAQTKAQVEAFLKLHGTFFLRHPVTCLEALVYSRNYYFTPWTNRGERITVSASSFQELTDKASSNFHPLLPDALRQKMEDGYWEWVNRPVMRELTGCGSYTWLSLLLFAAALWQRDRKKQVWLLSLLTLTFGLLFTHLNGAARYASPLIYTVPVFLLLYRVEEGNR